MKCVIAQHEANGQKYIYQVPEGREFLHPGDVIKVVQNYKHKTDETYALCLCNSFELRESESEFKNVMKAFHNDYKPNGVVLGRYKYIKLEEEISDE
mgnify:CR=1 FL=1